MFTKDTPIKMADGHTETAGHLASLSQNVPILIAATRMGGGRYPATGEGTAGIITPLQMSVSECLELVTSSGQRVKCAPRAKLCLVGSGFTFAEESAGAIVDTEAGPQIIVGIDRRGSTEELVSIRLDSIHAVLAAGIWFLED
jgi:hypothetical protein